MNEVEKFLKEIEKQKISGILRKLDELGRVVIPIDYRTGKVEDGETKIAIHNIKKYIIIEILKDQTEKTNKRFDELGRVVVYVEMRNKLNWKVRDDIEVWNYENYFILKKVEKECTFCANKENLTEYKGKLICSKCRKELVRV